MSFGVLNYSGMLFNKGNTRTPLSAAIGGRVKTTNHVEFVTGQEYTGGGTGSQPAISEGVADRTHGQRCDARAENERNADIPRGRWRIVCEDVQYGHAVWRKHRKSGR